MKILRILPALCLAMTAAQTMASTPAAWAEFKRDVEQSCLAKMRQQSKIQTGDRTQVRVSSFGSETYGAAYVSNKEKYGQSSAICIFDKAKRTVEIADLE